jgi:hypothetical protein
VNAYSAYEKVSTRNNVTVLTYIILNMTECNKLFRIHLEIVIINYVPCVRCD